MTGDQIFIWCAGSTCDFCFSHILCNRRVHKGEENRRYAEIFYKPFMCRKGNYEEYDEYESSFDMICLAFEQPLDFFYQKYGNIRNSISHDKGKYIKEPQTPVNGITGQFLTENP